MKGRTKRFRPLKDLTCPVIEYDTIVSEVGEREPVGREEETYRSESILEIIAPSRRQINMVEVEPDLPEPSTEPGDLFRFASNRWSGQTEDSCQWKGRGGATRNCAITFRMRRCFFSGRVEVYDGHESDLGIEEGVQTVEKGVIPDHNDLLELRLIGTRDTIAYEGIYIRIS